MISFHWCLLNVQGTFGVNTANDSILTLMPMPLSRHTIAQPSTWLVSKRLSKFDRWRVLLTTRSTCRGENCLSSPEFRRKYSYFCIYRISLKHGAKNSARSVPFGSTQYAITRPEIWCVSCLQCSISLYNFRDLTEAYTTLYELSSLLHNTQWST